MSTALTVQKKAQMAYKKSAKPAQVSCWSNVRYLKNLMLTPATKPFMNDIGLPVELNPYMKTYFDTAVRENRYYSEDWTFCENWRDIGGKVWVDKRVLLRHTGTYVFDFQTQDKLYQDLHALALQNGVAAPVDTAPAPAVAPATQLAGKKSKKK